MSVKPELKIIADHLRSSSFLIADGILPSNEGRGYVLRRIMRRAMRQIHKLGAKEPAMHKLVDVLISEMSESYPELSRARELIIETLRSEEEKFRETLEKGLKILEEEINQNNNKKISGKIAFKLYDTYGFPLDLTQDIAKEKKLEVDVREFDSEMEMQRERARKNWAGSGEVSEDKFYFELKEKFGETKFLYHETTKSNAKILGIIKNGKLIEEISFGFDSESVEKPNFVNIGIAIILDKTPFYATSGGQKGDDGNIFLANEFSENQKIDYKKTNNFLDISETKKFAGGLFVHNICDCKGTFRVGDEIVAVVNNRHRQLRAQNHSATHLLHKALKQVLGNSISQKGSNVDVGQLTFDFNLNRAMSSNEIEQVEELVNFYIRQNSDVQTKEMKLEEARETGAEALFGEKYDAKVRVVKMGVSTELCGGTHVAKTGNIGIFKIISENGIASGIRRITAKSGFYALQHVKMQEKKLQALIESLRVKQQFDEVKTNENEFLSSRVGFDEISFFNDESGFEIISDSQRKSMVEVIHKTAKLGEDIQNQLKQKDREIEKLKKQIWQGNLKNLTNEKLGQINFAYYVFEETEAKDLREITSEVKAWKSFSQSQILAFFAKKDGKIALCISVSSDLQSQFDASKIILPAIEKICGRGAGGKKDFAMGGGTNPEAIQEAVKALRDSLVL